MQRDGRCFAYHWPGLSVVQEAGHGACWCGSDAQHGPAGGAQARVEQHALDAVHLVGQHFDHDALGGRRVLSAGAGASGRVFPS